MKVWAVLTWNLLKKLRLQDSKFWPNHPAQHRFEGGSKKEISQGFQKSWSHTSHSAYVATETELVGAKIDGLLPPNFL